MTPSAAEIESIATRGTSRSSKRSTELCRRMLAGLGDVEPDRARGSLEELCAIGVDYGWRELKGTIRSDVLERTSADARANLHRNLQETLEWITRPCFDLEWTSFTLATEALRPGPTDASPTKETFLGKQPSDRLFALFSKFPVLAALWSVAIDQWRNHVVEILARATTDERALAHALFASNGGGRITNVQLGLSDRHFGGRSVALVEFEKGRAIYKPRTGTSEAAWASVLGRMNEHGFKPRLKEPRILRRKNYHWMEYVEPVGCRDAAAARRFYKRLGGLIAAAYLLNAVDCHRENLIAAGDQPVLVDIDALWQVSPVTKTQSATDLLFRTGFFPNSNPESLQSRSSALGRGATGDHLAQIGAQPALAANYAEQIIAGFRNGWRCLVGTPQNRRAFLQRTRQIRSQKRRWIYRATENYAAIIRASIQPAVLTSHAARATFLRKLLARPSATLNTVNAEAEAIEQLDVPYFPRKTNGRMPAVNSSPPRELPEAIRRALGWTR